MLVMNFVGGPGSGKSTAALAHTATLKKNGALCEYVSEYAKDIIWAEHNWLLRNDPYKIFAEQHHRLNRLREKVDIAVTDSPLFLADFYAKYHGIPVSKHFSALCVDAYKSFDNALEWCEYNHKFESVGREQYEDEAVAIHEAIKAYVVIHIDGG